MLRNYAPWGPLAVDEPPTGTGGTAGRWASRIPYAGGAIQAFMASQAAEKARGRMVKVPPAQNWFQNLLQSLGNTMTFMPGGGTAMTAAKIGVSGAQGLAGAPGMFGSSWESLLAGTGGAAIRGFADRTGVLRSMAAEPAQTWNAPEAMGWGQAPPSGGGPTVPSNFGQSPEAFWAGTAEPRWRGQDVQAP